MLARAHRLCWLAPCHCAVITRPPAAGGHSSPLSRPCQFLLSEAAGRLCRALPWSSAAGAASAPSRLHEHKTPLTLELVQTGVVQGLLGLDRRPEMLVYRIPSQGGISVLAPHRAALQRFRAGLPTPSCSSLWCPGRLSELEAGRAAEEEDLQEVVLKEHIYLARVSSSLQGQGVSSGVEDQVRTISWGDALLQC